MYCDQDKQQPDSLRCHRSLHIGDREFPFSLFSAKSRRTQFTAFQEQNNKIQQISADTQSSEGTLHFENASLAPPGGRVTHPATQRPYTMFKATQLPFHKLAHLARHNFLSWSLQRSLVCMWFSSCIQTTPRLWSGYIFAL